MMMIGWVKDFHGDAGPGIQFLTRLTLLVRAHALSLRVLACACAPASRCCARVRVRAHALPLAVLAAVLLLARAFVDLLACVRVCPTQCSVR